MIIEKESQIIKNSRKSFFKNFMQNVELVKGKMPGIGQIYGPEFGLGSNFFRSERVFDKTK